jgi:hypothetical protein
MGRHYLDQPPCSVEALALLATLPPGAADSLRMYLAGDYLILYVVDRAGSLATLLSIRHHRQLSFDFDRTAILGKPLRQRSKGSRLWPRFTTRLANLCASALVATMLFVLDAPGFRIEPHPEDEVVRWFACAVTHLPAAVRSRANQHPGLMAGRPCAPNTTAATSW